MPLPVHVHNTVQNTKRNMIRCCRCACNTVISQPFFCSYEIDRLYEHDIDPPLTHAGLMILGI